MRSTQSTKVPSQYTASSIKSGNDVDGFNSVWDAKGNPFEEQKLKPNRIQ